MATVGQLLKEAREAKFYSLDEVEKVTKIQKKMLQALENDDFSKLPPPTFVQGFIKNYAQFLGLEPQKLLAVFRREFATERHKPYVLDAFSNPIKKTPFQVTPTRLVGLVVMLLILSFFGYLWIQYHQLVGAPNLTVNTPQDQQTVETDSVLVEGTTDPETKVLVNSQEIPVAVDGHFKQEVKLPSPVSKLEIIATSKFNQQTKVERTVYLK